MIEEITVIPVVSQKDGVQFAKLMVIAHVQTRTMKENVTVKGRRNFVSNATGTARLWRSSSHAPLHPCLSRYPNTWPSARNRIL